jgi:hypothetical protein
MSAAKENEFSVQFVRSVFLIEESKMHSIVKKMIEDCLDPTKPGIVRRSKSTIASHDLVGQLRSRAIRFGLHLEETETHFILFRQVPVRC